MYIGDIMAYFPNSLMPLTPKVDSPIGSDFSSNVRITAADYNLHDEEIRAIEEYLGQVGGFNGLGLPKEEPPELKIFQRKAGDAPAGGDGAAGFLDISEGNIFDVIAQIVDLVNNVTEFRGQGSISGYVHSGQLMTFPENAHATFLSAIPSEFDTTINVFSTDGFPNQGVISILNDVQQATKIAGNRSDFQQTVVGGVDTVEWIRYSGKNATQFLNCERGYLNTTKGPHIGQFNNVRQSRFNRNRRDFCTFIDGVEVQICQRQFPAWRQRRRFAIPFYGIRGFKRDLINFIRRFGTRFALNGGRDPSVANDIILIADSQGILERRRGVPYLRSKSQSNRNKDLIGFVEAKTFVNALIDAGIGVEETPPDEFDVGVIPVFMGRLGVSHSVAAITRVTTLNIDAMQIIQTADGRLFTFIQDFANRDRTLQAISHYEAYFISSAISSVIGGFQ